MNTSNKTLMAFASIVAIAFLGVLLTPDYDYMRNGPQSISTIFDR